MLGNKKLILFEPVNLYPEYYIPPEGFIDANEFFNGEHELDCKIQEILAFDIWCLGVMLYEMVIEKEPFHNKKKGTPFNKSYRLKKDELEDDSIVSKELRDLIDKMLELDRSKRLTIDQIIEHPWITKKDFCDENFPLNEKKLLYELKNSKSCFEIIHD